MKPLVIFLIILFMFQPFLHAYCWTVGGKVNCIADPPSETEEKIQDLQDEVDQLKQDQSENNQSPCPPFCH